MAIVRKLVLAALGILAYQNREKIGNMLRGNRQPGHPSHPPEGLIDELNKGSTALGDILDRFREAGSGAKVDSWIRQGPNRPIQPSEVEAAIDVGSLAALSRQTGLSRENLIGRITQRLPEAVDAMTQNGVWLAESSDENLRDLLYDAPSGSFDPSNSAQPTPTPAREKRTRSVLRLLETGNPGQKRNHDTSGAYRSIKGHQGAAVYLNCAGRERLRHRPRCAEN